MRKLLLAATAMIGATAALANVASAQVAPPAVVVVPPPSPASALPSNSTLPGTVAVRLNARVVTDFMVGNDSGDGYKNAAGVSAKAQPYYFGEFARLYPGVDGVTANGIQYGAAMEIRQNSGGTGVNQATNNLPASPGNTLFFRREYGYVATPQLGQLRFGQTDGAYTLFMVGNFENFDYEGGWDGDLPGLFSSATQISWNVPDISTWYTTSKLIYLSPNFGGFDFGVDWEPSSNQTSGDGACSGTTGNNTIGLGCATVSSISGPYATISGDLARRRNMMSFDGRYRGAFGPVGLVVQGGYITSGHVSDANSTVDPVAYNGFGFVDGGVAVTFGGLAVGGHIDTGIKNGTGLLVKGGKHELTYVTGFSYAFGAYQAGVQFSDSVFQGAWNGNAATGAKNTLGAEHDIGLSVGGNFNWAPGATLYVDYLYGTRHQANRDFFAATTGKFNNNTRAQGFIVGNKFQW
jgi:hypothetical protein